eukprot:EG_transcript_25599
MAPKGQPAKAEKPEDTAAVSQRRTPLWLHVLDVVLLVLLASTVLGTSYYVYEHWVRRLSWADSEESRHLWSVISKGDIASLRAVLEDDPELAAVRSADGRGPLWWAYESCNTAMVNLLKQYGQDPESTDTDAQGVRPKDLCRRGKAKAKASPKGKK